MLYRKYLKICSVFVSVWVLLFHFTTISLAQEPVVNDNGVITPQQFVNPSYIYFAHLAPFTSSVGTSTLTIRVNGTPLLSLKYGQTTEKIDLTGILNDGGGYIQLPGKGQNPTALIEFVVNNKVISSTTAGAAPLADFHYYTYILIGDGKNQPLTVRRYDDGDSKTSPSFLMRVINAVPFTSPNTKLNVRMTSRIDPGPEGDWANYNFLNLSYTGYSVGLNATESYTAMLQNTYSVKIIRADKPLTSFISFPSFVVKDDEINPKRNATIFLVGDGVNQPYSSILSNFQHQVVTITDVYLPIVVYTPPEVIPPTMEVDLKTQDRDFNTDDGDYNLTWTSVLTPNFYYRQFSFNTPPTGEVGITTKDTSYSEYNTWPGTHYWRVRNVYGSGGVLGPWSNIIKVVVKPYAYLRVENYSDVSDLKVTISGNGIQDTITVKSTKGTDFSYIWNYFRSVPVGTYTISISSNNPSCDASATVALKNDTYVDEDPDSGKYLITDCSITYNWGGH